MLKSPTAHNAVQIDRYMPADFQPNANRSDGKHPVDNAKVAQRNPPAGTAHMLDSLTRYQGQARVPQALRWTATTALLAAKQATPRRTTPEVQASVLNGTVYLGTNAASDADTLLKAQLHKIINNEADRTQIVNATRTKAEETSQLVTNCVGHGAAAHAAHAHADGELNGLAEKYGRTADEKISLAADVTALRTDAEQSGRALHDLFANQNGFSNQNLDTHMGQLETLKWQPHDEAATHHLLTQIRAPAADTAALTNGLAQFRTAAATQRSQIENLAEKYTAPGADRTALVATLTKELRDVTGAKLREDAHAVQLPKLQENARISQQEERHLNKLLAFVNEPDKFKAHLDRAEAEINASTSSGASTDPSHGLNLSAVQRNRVKHLLTQLRDALRSSEADGKIMMAPGRATDSTRIMQHAEQRIIEHVQRNQPALETEARRQFHELEEPDATAPPLTPEQRKMASTKPIDLYVAGTKPPCDVCETTEVNRDTVATEAVAANPDHTPKFVVTRFEDQDYKVGPLFPGQYANSDDTRLSQKLVDHFGGDLTQSDLTRTARKRADSVQDDAPPAGS
ncbi:hypothetical protein Bsp3421_005652 [Burkholderia sp. FERM BP-3421]|jgi:hypothetical protein|uniref:hypothetical protein n=1 Tax=Burkholderia sp. FERM BP-3421 TaxID=1494466 RepID=UPI00235F5970|nr:hypothetical protein [Burkholderia sp. FERM BP-3421]WDD95476.1 hypothetical protein Bsp3421_005652 [Burkholderia sp. FERM BP-3421]